MKFNLAMAGGGALLAVIAGAQSLSAAPPAPDGALLFRQRCASCHADTTGKPSPIGPNLARVVGRKAGSAAFAYSPALKQSGLVWTRANLDKFLTSPGKLVPGTRMVIAVADAAQRKAILDHLAKPR